jgi:hypothetical protein
MHQIPKILKIYIYYTRNLFRDRYVRTVIKVKPAVIQFKLKIIRLSTNCQQYLTVIL